MGSSVPGGQRHKEIPSVFREPGNKSDETAKGGRSSDF